MAKQPKRDFFIGFSLPPPQKNNNIQDESKKRTEREIVKMLTSVQRDVSRRNNNNNTKTHLHRRTQKNSHGKRSIKRKQERNGWLTEKRGNSFVYLMYPKQIMPSMTVDSVSLSLSLFVASAPTLSVAHEIHRWAGIKTILPASLCFKTERLTDSFTWNDYVVSSFQLPIGCTKLLTQTKTNEPREKNVHIWLQYACACTVHTHTAIY